MLIVVNLNKILVTIYIFGLLVGTKYKFELKYYNLTLV